MPHQPVAQKNRRFARSMRKEPTEAENKLWQELRDRRLDKMKFRRQVPIGNYIVDFLCLEAKLIVELDGSQHADSIYDENRDAILKGLGFRMLRFWNDDVMRDLDSVCATIIAHARDPALKSWR